MSVPHLQYPIFRMVHYSNIGYILNHGICSKNHPLADPDYMNIGDTTLVEQRETYPVRIIPPGGNLGDYVPFYFGGHSPMLLNIKTGYRGIRQWPQQDIVFICCKIETVIQQCDEWCFTDGHAKNRITAYYNDIQDLHKIDWDTARAQQWQATKDDRDRFRRKQAEFLVKDFVPIECIHALYVRNQKKKEDVEAIVSNLGLNIPVKVDVDNKLYYP